MKKIKLGVSYNLFNGEELLKASILSIRNHVDYINVVWQDYSWTYEKANLKLKKILEELQHQGLVDEIIEYKVNKGINPRKGKCRKINLGIKDMKRKGVTHFLLMDVDEFYDGNEFEKAKRIVFEKRLTHSVCSIYDYRISSIYRMRDARDYCVGFIFKMTPFSYVVANEKINNMPCRIDLFRTVPFFRLFGNRFYYLNCVSMHHMTGIRNDYDSKMKSTISVYSEEGRKAIEYYSDLQRKMGLMSEEEIINEGYIVVDDRFDIEKELESFNKTWG